MTDERLSCYKNKHVFITGGMGFMGSNLAHALVSLGAKVTILDFLNPLYGGNVFNIEDIKDKIRFVKGDVREEKQVNELVKDKDIIFNLAGQVSYIDSINMPFEDLDINCKGHLVILEACRKFNRKAKIVFSSSRMVLGKMIEDPVTESHPANPLNLYGIHKLTAEKYHLLYFKEFGIRSVILRITNPYGERQQIKHGKYSLPGWFVRLAMEGQIIKIFGDGSQLRDYIHISDLVNIFLLTAIEDKTDGEIFNCGSGRVHKFREMAELVIKTVGSGSIIFVPWPENYSRTETGDFRIDISKLSKTINWESAVDLKEGLKRMFDYYKKNKDRYV